EREVLSAAVADRTRGVARCAGVSRHRQVAGAPGAAAVGRGVDTLRRALADHVRPCEQNIRVPRIDGDRRLALDDATARNVDIGSGYDPRDPNDAALAVRAGHVPGNDADGERRDDDPHDERRPPAHLYGAAASRTASAPSARNGPYGRVRPRAERPSRTSRAAENRPPRIVPTMSAGTTAPPSAAPKRSASFTSPIPRPAGFVIATTKSKSAGTNVAATHKVQRPGSVTRRSHRSAQAAGSTITFGRRRVRTSIALRTHRTIAAKTGATAAVSAP